MRVTATDLKNKLGQYLEASIREPVIVEKSGRAISVLISYHAYEKFLELEEKVWGLQAIQSEKKGYLGVDESAKLLNQLHKKLKHAKD